MVNIVKANSNEAVLAEEAIYSNFTKNPSKKRIRIAKRLTFW
jgi:hypothetical protein